MRSPLLIDKNVLQGFSKSNLERLAERHQLLMSDVLFYELMATDAVSRARCFSKLPDIENPIILLENMGFHLRYEMTNHAPSGKPSAYPLDMRFRFNRDLRSPDYVLPADVAHEVAAQRDEIFARIDDYVERARLVSSMIGQRAKDLGESRPVAIQQLRDQVCSLAIVREFVSGFQSPPGEFSLPPALLMDESWTIIQHTQASMLFAIDVYERFGAELDDPTFATRRATLLAHDLLDLEYLVLGVHEGAFATNEKKLRRMFCLLCLNGTLVPEQ